jgi:hypothetical protein
MIEREPELTVRISGKRPVRLYNEGSYPSFCVTTNEVIAQNTVDSFAKKISEYLWDGEKLDLRRIPFIKPLEIKVEGVPSKTKGPKNYTTYKNLLITTNYDNLKINGLKNDEGYIATFNPPVDHCTMPPSLFSDFQRYVREMTGAKRLKREISENMLCSVI